MAALFCSIQNPLHFVKTKQFSENENEININTSNKYFKTSYKTHQNINKPGHYVKGINRGLCVF